MRLPLIQTINIILLLERSRISFIVTLLRNVFQIYLNLDTLVRLSTIDILPFDDNICIREPCLNYEACETKLMFGSAELFEEGESILFRQGV